MLSKKCKYALKALRRLAMNNGRVTTTTEIAQTENIPKKFLEHILLELRKDAYISSKQGSEGGYYLLKKPNQIKLSEIYRMFEGAIALVPCASEKYYQPCDDCTDPDTCKMKKVFNDIRNKTYALLDKQTIRDLVEK